MNTRLRAVGLALLLALSGCFPVKEDRLQTVKPSPFGPAPAAGALPQRQLSPGAKQEAIHVDMIGQRLAQSNRETGLRPIFQTIGAPTPELFHRGGDCLYITEGLSKQCKTDGQLAALLAYEMGRMVAERQAMASPAMRQPEQLPPMDARIGSDSGGAFGSADGTRLAELANFEKEQPKRKIASALPPDPHHLARGFLEKAGFKAQDLEEATPLLQQARKSNEFERQLRGSPVVRPGPSDRP